MSRRRSIIVLALLIALLAGAEVVVRGWQSPKATVQIINEGDQVVEDLVVYYADTRLPLGRVPTGQSVQAALTVGPMGPLRLEYRQKGNALQGFQIADFDPVQLRKESFKQVLVIGTNQVQRYVEDDASQDDSNSLGEIIKRWLKSELGAAQ